MLLPVSHITVLLDPAAFCAVHCPSPQPPQHGHCPLGVGRVTQPRVLSLQSSTRARHVEVSSPGEQMQGSGCLCSIHAVVSCQACLWQVLWHLPGLQHPEQSAALSPKRPRHMSLTSPLCSAHYRFYSFQWGWCAAWLRPINMLQDHYPIKFPLILKGGGGHRPSVLIQLCKVNGQTSIDFQRQRVGMCFKIFTSQE